MKGRCFQQSNPLVMIIGICVRIGITVRKWYFCVAPAPLTALWIPSHPPPSVSLLLPRASNNHTQSHAFTTAARKQMMILNKYHTVLRHDWAGKTSHRPLLPSLCRKVHSDHISYKEWTRGGMGGSCRNKWELCHQAAESTCPLRGWIPFF